MFLTNFMRQLVTQHGHTGGHAAPGPRGEGDPDGHPVRQVVDPVPEDDHPGHAGDGAGGGVDVAVGVAVTVVRNLEEGMSLSLECRVDCPPIPHAVR